MKNHRTSKSKFWQQVALALSVLVATSCVLAANTGGDPDEGGVGGTGITGVGHVQAFGSIFVNGREYFLDSRTQIIIDGMRAAERDLRLGASVIVEGNGDPQSKTAQATRVISNHQLAGRVESVDKNANRFTVLGQTIHVSATTHIEGKPLAQLARGDAVAIYALHGRDGNWSATRVEPVTGRDPTQFIVNARPDKIDADRKEIVFGGQRLAVPDHIQASGNESLALRGHYQGDALIVDQIVTANYDIGRPGDVIEIEGQVVKDGPVRFVANGLGLEARELAGHISESIEDSRHAVVHGRVELDGRILVERVEFEFERPEIDHLKDDIRHPREDMEFERHHERPEYEAPERIEYETPERPEIDSFNIERIEIERPDLGDRDFEPEHVELPDFD